MKQLFILLLFLYSTFSVSAQTSIDFGVHAGLALYSGDLSPQPVGFSLDDLGYTGGAFFRFQFNKWVSLRTGLNYAFLESEDNRAGLDNLGLSFQTNVLELNGVLELSPFSLGYYSSQTVIVPYLAVGGGFFRFNPKTERNGNLIELQPLGTEGQGIPGYENEYSLVDVAFPFGVGIRFIRNDNISIGIEILGRKLQTDYIDDISGVSVRVGDIIENRGVEVLQISRPGISPDVNPDSQYRRGGFNNDFYYVSTLTVSWRISGGSSVYRPGKKGVICPRF